MSEILAHRRIGPMNRYQQGLDVGGPTAEQVEILCVEAANGYSISSCAAVCDLTKDTVDSWLHRGRKARARFDDGEDLEGYELRCAEFAELFERARAKGVRTNETEMGAMADQSNGAWTQRAWRLERGHRDEFAKFDPAERGGGVTLVLNASLSRGPEWEVVEVAATRAQPQLPAAPSAAGVPPVDS